MKLAVASALPGDNGCCTHKNPSVTFIFFSNSSMYCIHRFALVKEHLIEFNQLAMANSEGSDNMLNRVMPKDNIGLAALLKTKEAAWENGKLITPS